MAPLQWRIQDFPEEGAPTLGGPPGYDFIKISRKPHEIKEYSAPGGGARPLRPPLYSATALLCQTRVRTLTRIPNTAIGVGI